LAEKHSAEKRLKRKIRKLGTYIAHFDTKKGDIGGKNGYVRDINV